MQKILFPLLTGLCALLVACNSSVTDIASGGLGTQKSPSVYIAIFEDSSEYIDHATALFVKRLGAKTSRPVIQSPLVNVHREHIEDYKFVAHQEGIQEAKRAGAGLLVLGKLDGHGGFASHSINAFVTVQVIDVESSKLLSTIHRPSGLLIANSQYHCVKAATKRTADALAEVLEGKAR